MTFPDAKMRYCDRIGKGGPAMRRRSKMLRRSHAAGFRIPTTRRI